MEAELVMRRQSMGHKIRSIAIERFRAFRELKIEALGRVNLLTGRNNTGKSSVLEALRILASDASPAVIYSILQYREEDTGATEEEAHAVNIEGFFPISSLFRGYPELTGSIEPIAIATDDGHDSMKVTLNVGWFSEERTPDGLMRLTPQQELPLGEGGGVPAVVIGTGKGERVLRLGSFSRPTYRGRLRSEPGETPRMPCIFVGPHGGERTTALGSLWDKVALSDGEPSVVQALQIIDPQIAAVSMVGGGGPRRTRTAIVRAQNLPRPVPLRSYGDGLNRLFGVVLSLVNAKDGLLLIDEFENGMHYTVQLDVWRAVFRLAQELNVQVFCKDELAIATRDEIEVR
jgi:AAA ATPase-like protein/putative AbiEii toxin of type IV toxin-antitoxin system